MRKFGFLLLAIALQSTIFGQGRSHVPNRLLVGFKDGVTNSQVDDVVRNLRGAGHEPVSGTNVHTVTLPNGADESAFLNAFSNRPEVDFVEFDELVPVAAAVTPNDPDYSTWQSPYLGQLSAPSAWSQSTGSSSVVIAIIDTGVDGTHPDLASKMVAGWNIYSKNSDTSDVYGHGTEVAGTAAAATDNGTGIAGVCWQCLIMPIRVADKTGYATFSNMAAGITWAATHGAKIANLSFEATTSSTVTAAAQAFANAGGVLTIAAGNEGTFVSSPSSPYALTVGGVMLNDALYSWSNYGNVLSLVAPGCVYTTANGGSYGAACGTSFAAPLVAGVAGLMMSANPSLTSAQVISIIEQSADGIGGTGWNSTFGWGELDANNALKLATTGNGGTSNGPNVSITTPAANTTVSGTITTTAAASSGSSTVASVTFLVDGGLLCTATAAPYECGWNSANSGNGSHTVSATARDALGNATSTSETVTVSNGSVSNGNGNKKR